jgi:hypothetical protein
MLTGVGGMGPDGPQVPVVLVGVGVVHLDELVEDLSRVGSEQAVEQRFEIVLAVVVELELVRGDPHRRGLAPAGHEHAAVAGQGLLAPETPPAGRARQIRGLVTHDPRDEGIAEERAGERLDDGVDVGVGGGPDVGHLVSLRRAAPSGS